MAEMDTVSRWNDGDVLEIPGKEDEAYTYIYILRFFQSAGCLAQKSLDLLHRAIVKRHPLHPRTGTIHMHFL